MKVVVSSIFISTSLMMFFIHGLVKNVAGYYLESYSYPMLHTLFPWLPWLTLIIGLFYFFAHIFTKNENER
jgi:hypothetical protein